MYTIAAELPEEAGEIEALLDRAFGPDRHGKTVYRLRQGVEPVRELCFTLRNADGLIASIRYWPVLIGTAMPALLLGPIGVEPAVQGKGYGVALMTYSLAQARAQGHRIVLLVGDHDYYARFGFTRAATDGLSLPGPVDRNRFLGLELEPGALAGVTGLVGQARCLRAA